MTSSFDTVQEAPAFAAAAPLVSVVAPNYNHGRYLEACLDSIMFQDYPNIELIIVDDASTDDSPELIRGYIAAVEADTASFASRYNKAENRIERTDHARYPQCGRRIIYLQNDANLGSTASYNRGFKAASGEFCTFVATDDLCHPLFISTLAAELVRTGADFAYADMFIIDDRHRVLREFKLPDYSFAACFANWYLCGVATLYRRALHESFGWYDETALADDHECYLRFAMGGARFVHVPKTLYSVRSHTGRQTGLHEFARFEALLKHSCQLTLKAREFALQSNLER